MNAVNRLHALNTGETALASRWYLIGTIIFASTFIIYLLFPSQQYDKDILPELARINALDPASPDPGHMLYALTGIPFYRIWLNSGYSGDALRAMQLMNAFFGAGTLALFALVLQMLKIHRFALLTVTLSVGFSYAFWTHTEDAFFIIPAAFFAVASLLCAILLSREDLRYRWTVSVILALNLGFAALFYQANLLLTPALMAASWTDVTLRRKWFGQWLLIAVVAGLFAGGVWLVQALSFAGVRDVGDFVRWFVAGHSGVSNGPWRREGVPFLSTSVVAWIATILPVYEGTRLRALLRGQINLLQLPSQLAFIFLGLAVLLSTLAFWTAVGLLFTIAIGNFLLAILSNNLNESIEIRRAEAVKAEMQSRDMLISATFDWTYYVRHFCETCRVVNAVDLAQSTSQRNDGAVSDALAKIMAETWDSGGNVYVVEYFVNRTDSVWERWTTPLTGITSGFINMFDREVAWTVEDEIVWLLREP